MALLPSVGESNRLDKGGDSMQGNLQIDDGVEIQLTDATGTPIGRMRRNGNDLEFRDATTGAWVKLDDLRSGGLVTDLFEVHTATPGQTVFNLTGSYVPGTDSLLVFVSRILALGPAFGGSADYVETGPTTVTFAVPMVGGELVAFIVPKGVGVDTFAVKGDAADQAPSNLEDKLSAGNGLLEQVTGSPANSVVEHRVDYSAATPQQSTGAGSAGASNQLSRGDHIHPAPAQDPPLSNATPLQSTGVGSPGAGTDCSRDDHVHPAPAQDPPLGSATPLQDSGAGSPGVSGSCSRQDHVHPAPSGIIPISGLKGTLIAAGSALAPLNLVIESGLPDGTYRWYIGSHYHSGSVVDYKYFTFQGIRNIFVPDITYRAIANGGGGYMFYRIYRIDEF